MTHLSDFSFLQRMVSFGYLYVWYTYRVWTLDRFKCLNPKRFQQGELKSIVTLLILFMIPFQLFYDITSVKIKYEEGFANLLGHIITKPELMWTKSDQSLVIPTEYSLCIGFSLQTGTLVLLQCFWNYLANSVAKASFMSSKEFMFYIFWTFASFIIFPVLQYNFSRDIYPATYKEIMPEMVYGIELFIVGCLGVVSHFRFRKLLQNSRDTVNGRSITQKIRYFQEINVILSTVLFGHGTLLTILSGDGLTNRKLLNAHKFSADFFICNINMCAVITWLCMILIFHPKNSSINPTDEPVADDKVSTSQSQTLVLGSNITEDYQSYSKSSRYKAPSTVSTFTDNSNYQFGPLPPAPPPDLNQYGLPTGPVVPASDARSRRMSKASQHIEVVVKKDDMPLYPKKINYEGYVPPPLPYDASSTASSRKNSKGRSILTLPCHDDIGEFGNLGQLEQTSEVSLDQRLLLKTEDETSYHSQFSIASSMNEQSNDH